MAGDTPAGAGDSSRHPPNCQSIRLNWPPLFVMKRNSAGAPVRERILEIARDLILSRGFSAMSVDAVCAQAGITKGGFFHHFPSKAALGEAVMHKFWADAVERLQQVRRDQHASQLDYVVAYLDHAISCYQDPQLGQGCMLAVFTMGLAETDPGLYEISQRCFAQWRSDLVAMFEALKLEQNCEQFDALAWSELYIASLEGALVLAKSAADATVIARALGLFKQQLIRAVAAYR